MKVLSLILGVFLVGCGAETVKVEVTETQPETETEAVEVIDENGDEKTVEVEKKETVVVEEVVEEVVEVVEEVVVAVVADPVYQLSSFAIATPSNAIAQTTATFTWSASGLEEQLSLTSTIEYDLKVGATNDCSNPTQSYTTSDTTQALTTLAEGTHYVCLTAKEGDKRKDAGNSPYELTVALPNPVPAAFSITSIASTVNTTTLDISWGASENATSYDLTIADASDCSGGSSYNGLTGTSQSITKPEGTYYVCVNAKDDNDTIAASNNSMEFAIDVEFGLVNAPVPNNWSVADSVTYDLWTPDWITKKSEALTFTATMDSTTHVFYVFTNSIIKEKLDSGFSFLTYYSKVDGEVATLWRDIRTTYSSADETTHIVN